MELETAALDTVVTVMGAQSQERWMHQVLSMGKLEQGSSRSCADVVLLLGQETVVASATGWCLHTSRQHPACRTWILDVGEALGLTKATRVNLQSPRLHLGNWLQQIRSVADVVVAKEAVRANSYHLAVSSMGG